MLVIVGDCDDCDCDEKPKRVLLFVAIRKVYFAIGYCFPKFLLHFFVKYFFSKYFFVFCPEN